MLALVSLLFLNKFVAGTASPASKQLLAGTPAGPQGGAVEAWAVQLPEGILQPKDYLESCASMNMKPVCAGSHSCENADSQCIVLQVETLHCGAPMHGLSQSLGFASPESDFFDGLCNYMADQWLTVEIGPSKDATRCVKASWPRIECSEHVDSESRANEDFPGAPDTFAVSTKATADGEVATDLCAERLDLHQGWDQHLAIRCKKVGSARGVCGGAHGYLADSQVMGTRFAFCAGYPRAERNAFLMEAGECQVEGDCISSPEFPNNYLSSDMCAVTVLKAGTIHVQHFDTQKDRDVFTVQGTAYSGFQGPEGITVQVGDGIKWSTDSGVTDSGWRICIRQNNLDYWIEVAALAIIFAVTAASATTLVGIAMLKKRGSWARILLQPLLKEEASHHTSHHIENCLAPCVFDIHQDGKDLRCIRLAVPVRIVECQVQIKECGPNTHVHVSLTKKHGCLPEEAAMLSLAPDTSGFEQIHRAWHWEKTFEFDDELWELYEPASTLSLERSIDLDGAFQVCLARKPLPTPNVRQFGWKAKPETYEIASTSDTEPAQSSAADSSDFLHINP